MGCHYHQFLANKVSNKITEIEREVVRGFHSFKSDDLFDQLFRSGEIYRIKKRLDNAWEETFNEPDEWKLSY